MQVRNETWLPTWISLNLFLLNWFVGGFHLNHKSCCWWLVLVSREEIVKIVFMHKLQYVVIFQRLERFILDLLGMKIRGYCLAHVFVCLSIYLCIRPTRCIRMQSVKNLILNSTDSLQLLIFNKRWDILEQQGTYFLQNQEIF